MFGEAQWIAETPIAELVVSETLTIEDYYEYLAEETRLLEERPDQPIYLLLDVRELRELPQQISDAIGCTGNASSRIQGVAVVGKRSLLQFFGNLFEPQSRLIFAPSRDAALAALADKINCDQQSN